MKKLLRWAWENLPMLLAFGIAFWAGFWLKDFEAMRWWIIMATFFMVLRELSEIRHRLIKLVEEDDDNDSKGRHHGGSDE